MANKTENRSINLFLNGRQAGGSIKQMESEFRKLNRETKKLDVNSRQYRENMARLSQLDGRIKAHRKQIRGVQTSWQKLTGIVKKFAPFAATAIAGRAFMNGVRNAIRTINEYQDANAKLRAVLSATREETEKLREQQIELGSSTAFTAAQAADAQTELAKLGFTMREIINLTPAVLDLAAASGTDLANAATIAGSTLRQFGLDANETDRVVDVMAKSFSSSSLDIEKFSVAMSAAGPVAKAVGLDIERTTALIGTLTDQGLDASTAGTSLRNVFLDLKKAGLEFDEAMAMIRNSSDQAATAFDLFGKRGATTGVILANNAEAAGELEEKLRDAAGAAKEMAEAQLDTLSGDITKLTSAWDGFVLAVENGEGIIGKAARAVVQSLTEILNLANDDNLSTFEKLSMWFAAALPGGTGAALIGELKGLQLAAQAMNKHIKDLASDENMDGLTELRAKLIAQRHETEEGTTQYRILGDQIRLIAELQREMAAGDGDGGGNPNPGADPGATEDPKVSRARITMQTINTLTAELGGELNRIEKEIADKGLAIRSEALWDWEKIAQDVADGDERRAMEKLQATQAMAAGVGQSLNQIASAAGASAEYQQEIGGFMNQINAGIALGQAVSSVKAGDPFTYIALLTSIAALVTSVTNRAAAATNAAALPAPPAFATGTDSAPGGLALVGETGPELVNIPEGSAITPSGPSRNLIFGSNPQLDFGSVPDLAGGSGASLVEEMRAMRSEMASWPSRLRVENVQTDFDEYDDRYQRNRKRVRNVRA